MKTKNQGEFTIFPAGAIWQIGIKSLDGLLFSTTEYGVTEATVAEARKLIAELQPRHVIIDSGLFHLVGREKGRQITHDENRPVTTRGRVNIAPWHVIDFAQKLDQPLWLPWITPLGSYRMSTTRGRILTET